MSDNDRTVKKNTDKGGEKKPKNPKDRTDIGHVRRHLKMAYIKHHKYKHIRKNSLYKTKIIYKQTKQTRNKSFNNKVFLLKMLIYNSKR